MPIYVSCMYSYTYAESNLTICTCYVGYDMLQLICQNILYFLHYSW